VSVEPNAAVLCTATLAGQSRPVWPRSSRVVNSKSSFHKK
jgi:hypothetical protein